MIRALLVLTIGLCCVNAFAEEPPFAAIVSGENVNMRSGPDLNFEIIGKLNRKKKLVVTGKKEGWYKVQLPADILSYIHKDYLDVEGAVGKVKGDRVNIRCGAGENFTILGQINNGESVAILGKKGEWWEIKPLKEAAGWVHSDFVQFYAKVDDYIAEEGLRLKKEDILSGLEKR
ncbi:MAG: SH3 domain-containing protein [Candidatus Omnitrophica bacterium]|nr:SH3 domain-containing protein [Candidatus Omnitrophota bacterium]